MIVPAGQKARAVATGEPFPRGIGASRGITQFDGRSMRMTLNDHAVSTSPDANAQGLTAQQLDALRYDNQSAHPEEVAGRLHLLMPSNVRVLDVGCGTGSVTVIANHGRDNVVVGIEADAARAEVARLRGLTVHTGLFCDVFVEECGLFDVIMSADVLEHVTTPADFLRTMVRALKPDGLLLISVPNVAHWSVRLMLLMGRFEYEPVGIMDATHLRWFTAESLAALFEQCGLELIEMHQTAGTELPVYQRGLFRRIPFRIKGPTIRILARIFPLLFGVQHVVMARVRPALPV